MIRILYVCLLGLVVNLSISAQTVNNTPDTGSATDRVSYPAGFFEQYRPNTALEMVQQVPGFQLDDGSNARGFGSSAGNVLINGRRPSTKQDALSAILTRIPASYVASIELIHGQAQGVDLQGQAVIANILLLEDAPAAVRWKAALKHNFNNPQIGPDVGISLSDRWKEIDYNAGISVAANPRSYEGPETVYDGSGRLSEQRSDDNFRDSSSGEANLNAAKNIGMTLVRLNTKLAYAEQDGLTTSYRVPVLSTAITRNELFGDDQSTREFELGVDAEHALSTDFTGKAIYLFYGKNNERDTDQRTVNLATNQTTFYRQANTETHTRENIGRLEFDWTGIDNHALQGNIELAFNSVDGTQVQTEDRGKGAVPVVVPGANTRVEELRWDLKLLDTWNAGQLVVNYGLGLERSTITSSGDTRRERSFTYLKPQAQLSWPLTPRQQIRISVLRQVAQLDFNEFISTSVFEDDDLALGNTSLVPERTWVSELALESRFGDIGVLSLTGFYHHITDVQDLLPVTAELEVPGNIGNGSRLGVEMEATLPLDWLKLASARLDLKARKQHSSVTDPVTGEKRVLSGKTGFGGPTIIPFRDESDEYEYVYDVAYRQDFKRARVAWGWDIAERAERILFRVNELDKVDESELEFNAFAETTRFWGIKIRVEGQNILSLAEERDRTVFAGSRNTAMTNILRHELRSRDKGFRMFLTLSGAF